MQASRYVSLAITTLAVMTPCSSVLADDKIPAMPTVVQVMEQVTKDYADVATEEDAKSIEAWCRSALSSVNFERDEYLLLRSFQSTDGQKAWDILAIVTSLKKLEKAEADLLCPQGAIP